MSLHAFAVPVLPGKLDKHRTFMQGVGRSPDARAMHDKAGIDRLRVYQQEMPQGDFAVVLWDTDDGERAMQAIVSATDEYSRNFRAELVDIHGPDVVDPAAWPKTELVGEWSSSRVDPRGTDWAFLVPIGRGRVDAYRAMVDEMVHGRQREGFEQTRTMLGVNRQTMFLLETSTGAFALPVLEGPGSPRVFAEQLQRDDHPFFPWWRDQIRLVTGRIPTNPPRVKKVIDLMVHEPAVTKR